MRGAKALLALVVGVGFSTAARAEQAPAAGAAGLDQVGVALGGGAVERHSRLDAVAVQHLEHAEDAEGLQVGGERGWRAAGKRGGFT